MDRKLDFRQRVEPGQEGKGNWIERKTSIVIIVNYVD